MELTRKDWMLVYWKEMGEQYIAMYLTGISCEEDKEAMESIKPEIKGRFGEIQK